MTAKKPSLVTEIKTTTTREWADKKAELKARFSDYTKTRFEFENLTKELLKKLTWAKNKKYISIKELYIMRYRYRDHLDYLTIARKMDVTYERIRMIEEGIIEKLLVLD